MIRDLLFKFFDGQTIVDEEQKIKQWLEESNENRKLFIQERKIYDAILLSAEARNAQIGPKSGTAIKMLPRLNKLLRVASVVLITLSVSWFYSYLQSNNNLQTIAVPTGHRANIILPDGTSVWLNSRTTMTYPLAFNKKSRDVEINGEAYFEVARKKRHPFRVKTPKGVIEVLGTKFNVVDYSDHEVFETALMEGSVKLHTINNPDNVVILSPGNMSFLQNGHLEGPYKYDDYGQYRWREGLICFKDASFPTIMKSFETRYSIRIQIENLSYQDLYFTGKFRQEDGVDYALRVLQKDIGFKYERDDDTKIITIK